MTYHNPLAHLPAPSDKVLYGEFGVIVFLTLSGAYTSKSYLPVETAEECMSYLSYMKASPKVYGNPYFIPSPERV